jgi:hypothetical protein
VLLHSGDDKKLGVVPVEFSIQRVVRPYLGAYLQILSAVSSWMLICRLQPEAPRAASGPGRSPNGPQPLRVSSPCIKRRGAAAEVAAAAVAVA